MYEPRYIRPLDPAATKFRPPISDFSERYVEPSVDAHGNPREVIWGIIAALIVGPIAYIAFCAVLALGDIF